MNQRPVAIGLLLCEQVIFEERTRNATPVNCFTHRRVNGFPSEPFPFAVFAMLTDALGEIRLELLIERLDTLEEVHRRAFSHRSTDPLQILKLRWRVRDLSFPVPGHYQVRLMADNETLAHCKVVIHPKENST
jgi:hypothetical protein